MQNYSLHAMTPYLVHFQHIFPRTFAFKEIGYPSARKVDKIALKLKETKRRRKKFAKMVARKKR